MKIRKLIPGWIKEWINYIGICEKIDDSISIAKNSKVYPGVTIGKYSYVNGNSYIFSGSIGRYCSIGYNVQIGPPEHPIHNFSLHPRFYKYWGGGTAMYLNHQLLNQMYGLEATQLFCKALK